MDIQLRFVFFVFLGVVFFLSIPNMESVFAQDTQSSNCVLTIVGTPDPKQALPPGCTAASGGNQQVIKLALQQLGKPYVWGAPGRTWASDGPSPASFDCSGLVGWAWYTATNGKVNFPGNTCATWGGCNGEAGVSSDKFQKFTAAQKDQIQPGDAIYFTNPPNVHHTALYEGPGNCPSKVCIIEAQQSGVPIKESDYASRVSGSDPMVGFIRPINY